MLPTDIMKCAAEYERCMVEKNIPSLPNLVVLRREQISIIEAVVYNP